MAHRYIYRADMETLPREDLNKLQLERLQAMVDYCLQNSPFYQKKLTAAGITSGSCIQTLQDIEKIPFTTKEELRENYPYGLLAVPMNKVARIHASSGTTGKPTLGFYTKADLETWADASARVLALNECGEEDILQISVGYGLFTGALGFHQGAEKVGCTIIPASTGNTEKQLVMMHDLGTSVLMATPSYAACLAEKIAASGKKEEFKLQRVLFGAERCSDTTRKMIEDILEVETRDNYGMTEFMGPGFSGECYCRNGMHVTEDVFYPEIIDPDTGAVLADGQVGELIITSLQREAMPVLRYRTRDLTSLDHRPCPCGRTSVRVRAPMGRTDDMFVFKGINVFPSQVECAMSQIPELSPHYKITLERDKQFRDTAFLDVELNDNYSEEKVSEIRARFERELRGIIIVRMQVRLLPPDSVERFQGKAKRVVDNRYTGEHSAK